MPDPKPDTTKQAVHDDDALPVARRLARAADKVRTGAFPLRWPRSTDVERLSMVGWYNPRQLLHAGLEKVVSTVIGARSDQRIVQALASRRLGYYDYGFHYRVGRGGPYIDRSRPRDDIWIDYVADTGDGWNSTYAIAHAVAQPQLRVQGAGGAGSLTLPRGDVLVFGGDEVYPTPSREAYHHRLIVPFEQAFGDDHPDETPHVFAIPGNHDWYDGLSAFSRLFASDVGGRYFAGWRTRQHRSYFALKLPGRWWLVGSDGQLQADIDTPQIEYFRRIADRHMQPGDRVIVCLAYPSWVYAHKYRSLGGRYDETDLLYLRSEIFAKRGIIATVFLAGDNHHYRRHQEVDPAEPTAPVQKITAGGGGAFLHPTHDEDVSRINETWVTPEQRPRVFQLEASYPGVRTSSRVAFGNLLFPWNNPTFGSVPAIVYLLSAWLVSATMVQPEPASVAEAWWLTIEAFRRNPGLTLWVASITVALVLFTDTHSRVYQWLGGLAHAAAHWACLFALAWGSVLLARLLLPYWGVGRFALDALLIGAGAWVLGSAIVGFYLLISLNVFGRHSEEAFSALRIQDYKHFLRLHLARDGTMTIYPIAIPRVPRVWGARAKGATGSRIVPQEPFEPVLIEPPIVLRPPPAS
jgi:hypothetical protein